MWTPSGCMLMMTLGIVSVSTLIVLRLPNNKSCSEACISSVQLCSTLRLLKVFEGQGLSTVVGVVILYTSSTLLVTTVTAPTTTGVTVIILLLLRLEHNRAGVIVHVFAVSSSTCSILHFVLAGNLQRRFASIVHAVAIVTNGRRNSQHSIP